MARRSQDRLRKSVFLFSGDSRGRGGNGVVTPRVTMGTFGAVTGRSGFGHGGRGTGWRLDPHLAL